jgi:hypothetical protein
VVEVDVVDDKIPVRQRQQRRRLERADASAIIVAVPGGSRRVLFQTTSTPSVDCNAVKAHNVACIRGDGDR